MGLFGKSKKKSDCCDVQIEEVKDEKKDVSSSATVTEEVKSESDNKNQQGCGCSC